MSANNFLFIDGRFRVWDRCADAQEVDFDNEGFLIGGGKDLIDAIKIANKYLKKHLVEYGLEIADGALNRRKSKNEHGGMVI